MRTVELFAGPGGWGQGARGSGIPAAGLRPFFTYFGGKFRAAPHYPPPQHPVIIEPFAGSAGYALRYPTRDVLLIDLDEKIIGTWQYLIRTGAEEIRRLPLCGPEWETVQDLDLPQEARWLIGWWLNKGTTDPANRPSAWMRNPDHNVGCNFWGNGVRERLATQVEHIRHWKAVHSSYIDAPDITATWFIDPPYEVAGGRYRVRDVDYPHLAQWSQERQGQVIVCENVGAKWLPFVPLRASQAMSGRGRSGSSDEAIWTAA